MGRYLRRLPIDVIKIDQSFVRDLTSNRDSTSIVRAVLDSIKTIDKVLDAGSGTFGVRLELPNADRHLPAGLRCKDSFVGVDLAAPVTRGAAEPIRDVGPTARPAPIVVAPRK